VLARALHGLVGIGTCALVGCGGPGQAGGADGGGNCDAYLVPATTDLTQPVVSFKTDVMKIFNNNCGLSTCHGSTSLGKGSLFLGAETAHRADASEVRAGIVGQASVELPSMPFVTAGDPEKSYLMHKLDGDQCAFDGECVDGTCHVLMPSGGNTLLPVAFRDVVRRWIAQGAQDN